MDWEKFAEEADTTLCTYSQDLTYFIDNQDIRGVRDVLSRVQFFVMGLQHIAGLDGDSDMHDVLHSISTHFIKDEADLKESIAHHYERGIKQLTLHGDFPRMVLKSAIDYPQVPAGTVLHSAKKKRTEFRDPPVRVVDMHTDPIIGNRLMEHFLPPDPVEFGSVASLTG